MVTFHYMLASYAPLYMEIVLMCFLRNRLTVTRGHPIINVLNDRAYCALIKLTGKEHLVPQHTIQSMTLWQVRLFDLFS